MRGLVCVLLIGLGACRPDPAQEHLKRELSFFQSTVDPEREASEVRRVLRQRGMVVQRELEDPLFWAVAAGEPGGPLSAVRVVTKRGVVFGIDGDLHAPLLAFSVALADGIATTVGELTLVGVVQRPRALDVGCLRLFRILPDGRIAEVGFAVSRFGERACVARLDTERARFFATVAWPGLAAVRVPTLAVELQLSQVLLGQEERSERTLAPADDGAWIARARALFEPDQLAGEVDFSARHALGVARAAVTAAEGKGVEPQRAAYLSALLPVRAGSPEAGVVSDTLAHIERGWLDATPTAADVSGDQTVEPVSEADVAE